MFDETFYPNYVTQTKSLQRQSMISKSNIIYWKKWDSLTEKEQETLTPADEVITYLTQY